MALWTIPTLPADQQQPTHSKPISLPPSGDTAQRLRTVHHPVLSNRQQDPNEPWQSFTASVGTLCGTITEINTVAACWYEKITSVDGPISITERLCETNEDACISSVMFTVSVIYTSLYPLDAVTSQNSPTQTSVITPSSTPEDLPPSTSSTAIISLPTSRHFASTSAVGAAGSYLDDITIPDVFRGLGKQVHVQLRTAVPFYTVIRHIGLNALPTVRDYRKPPDTSLKSAINNNGHNEELVGGVLNIHTDDPFGTQLYINDADVEAPNSLITLVPGDTLVQVQGTYEKILGETRDEHVLPSSEITDASICETDGGFRLAGGRLGEANTEGIEQESMSEASTLPPLYSDYLE
ncbi:hypothetical protein BD311DRAFT_851955 [Dichomitus squalens]|uniref:Uncharacterized protein n=1 Tax=Dichomitus squalens TaxID=114155 RepID=A0A4Q9MIJ9_9APHY|nr:hypothetical protein BD311DRAFT_851955 [Dichomitus squalens]